MTYQPQPIDTSEVVIDTEHLKLTELLAKNTHDIWAQQRLADGWQYGPQRDDSLKQHPGLIPYEDLPDSEKEYDRLTALGVIKTLLALGYRLEGQRAIPNQPDPDEEAKVVTLLKDLKKSGEINISSLLNIHRETIKIKPHTPIIYQVLGEAILQLGEPLMAYDVLKEGLKQWPDDVRLRQLIALALARSGATHKANHILTQLVAQGHEETETLSLHARTYKDLWLESNNPLEQKHYLELAAKRYQQAYQKNRNIYPGINAATMTAIAGEQETAQAIAHSVQEQCLQQLPSLEKITTQDYWTLATLGEANLILQQWSQATDWYQQAVKVGHRRYGNLSSTRRNAKILLESLEGNSDRLASWFKLPCLAVFSGHMIDLPDRPQPRFPAHLETQVYQAIRARLSQLDVSFGYASAACGSDILATNLRRDKRNEDDESENQVWFAAACREPSCPFGCFNSVEPRAVQRLFL